MGSDRICKAIERMVEIYTTQYRAQLKFTVSFLEYDWAKWKVGLPYFTALEKEMLEGFASKNNSQIWLQDPDLIKTQKGF